MKQKTSSTIPARVALCISVFFSPFIVPIVSAVFIVKRHASSSHEVYLWVAVIAVFVTILPILSVLLLFRFSKVSNIHLHDKDERLLPLCITCASMALGAIVLYNIGASWKIVWVCLAFIVNGVVFSIITPFWKISFHTSVATGCILVLVLLLNVKLVWLFLIIPIITWARVYRKRHTLLQTLAGTVVATINTVLFYIILPF